MSSFLSWDPESKGKVKLQQQTSSVGSLGSSPASLVQVSCLPSQPDDQHPFSLFSNSQFHLRHARDPWEFAFHSANNIIWERPSVISICFLHHPALKTGWSLERGWRVSHGMMILFFFASVSGHSFSLWYWYNVVRVKGVSVSGKDISQAITTVTLAKKEDMNVWAKKATLLKHHNWQHMIVWITKLRAFRPLLFLSFILRDFDRK